MKPRLRRLTGEQGSVLVQVAVSLLALTAFSAFVIDYGVFWVSRAQAQNAADAGALAGAVARAFDNYLDQSDTGPGKQAARALATANRVWLEPPSVQLVPDIDFPSCTVMGGADPTGFVGSSPCVRVNVHRTAARGAALPTYFARLFGINSQDVRATAWAQVVIANASDCLKPIAIADKWQEVTTVLRQWPNSLARFNKYSPSGALLNPKDVYTPPSSTTVTVGGYQFALPIGGLGQQLTLTEVSSGSEVAPGQFIGVDLPQAAPTANSFDANMVGCNGTKIGMGQPLVPRSGSVTAAAVAGAAALFNADPGATWNTATKSIQNSCAASSPPCASFSPRLVALPVFNLDLYDSSRFAGPPNLQMVNVIGFFIESAAGAQITGRVAFHPGLIKSSSPSVAYPYAFLRTAMLVR